MQQKTMTTLNQLRIGDSFVFPRRTDVWRVMARADKKGRVAINQIVNGRAIFAYDELKKGSKEVMFLRHTIPVPGEECFIEDLKEGDRFHMTDDIIHEWEIVQVGPTPQFVTIRRTDQPAPGKAGVLAKVVFISHKQTTD